VIQRAKILSSILSFGDRAFTVREIVEATGAKPATVRTVLDRSHDWFERLEDRQPTGRPGGRWHVYRLRAGTANKIKDDIALLHEPGAALSVDDEDRLPPALLTAEDLLLDSPRDKLQEMLPAVQSLMAEVAFLQDHNSEGECYDGALLQAHISLVSFLLDLAKAPQHQHPLANDKSGVRFVQIIMDLAKSQVDDRLIGRTLRAIGSQEVAEGSPSTAAQGFERSSPAAMGGGNKEASSRQFVERLQSQGWKTLENNFSMLNRRS